MPDNTRYEKLTRGNLEDTKIFGGHSVLTIQQLENEIDINSEIGKKLKSIEDKLKEY